ncbi:hypothetical protein GCM10022415_15120 [Knoellia locipacati]|uniref:Uncharacterized protein n=1 Tax=Knoellia locipacati TaxID=882824 RepID=A0A512SZX4_9MICO|nr:hypothetical protein KLO01_15100 [Knoellia locipacati]
MVEHLDDFEITVTEKRKDDVARPEARMHTPVDGLDSELLGQACSRRSCAVVLCGIDNMVNSHADYRDTRSGVLLTQALMTPILGPGQARGLRCRTAS